MSERSFMEARVRWNVFAPCILLAAILAVYANSFSGAFVRDDLNSIVQNPYLGALWPPSEATRGLPLTAFNTRPLPAFSLRLSYLLSGREPWGYHVVNVLIHALAALTLYGLLRGLLSAPALQGRFEKHAEPLALSVALLWALHPVQTNCVTYITQRIEAFYSLFLLLVLYAFLRSTASKRASLWKGMAVLACVLGMLSKEAMVGAPLLLLAFDRLFVSGSFTQALRRNALLYACMFLTWSLLLSNLGRNDLKEHLRIENEGKSFTAWNWFLSSCDVLIHYLRLAFWPSKMQFRYTWPIAQGLGDVWWQFLCLLALGLSTVWGVWKGHAWSYPGVLFFVVLAPSSSFMPLTQVASDHRMYLPLLAPLCLIVLAGYRALARIRNEAAASRAIRFAGFAVLAWIAVLGTLTLKRNEDYRTHYRLWASALEAEPRNHQALIHAGIHELKRGRRERAAECFRRAVEADPSSSHARYRLGRFLADEGRYEEAVAQFRRVRSGTGHHAGFHVEFGQVLLAIGAVAEAEDHFSRAKELDPGESAAYVCQGLQYGQEGRLEDAEREFRRALDLDPWRYDALVALGSLLGRRGKYQEAQAPLRLAVQLEPEDPEPIRLLMLAQGHLLAREALLHTKHGWELCGKGQPDAGLRELHAALSKAPDFAEARHYLAVVRRKLEEDVAGGGEGAELLQALASAYAVEGKFEEAGGVAKLALALAQAAGERERAAELDARLKAYAGGRAFPDAEPPAP
ncbi:MAG: tetratricopeptide repeat protein [Planctomycetota bacterium]|nr:tetratricopeptide repeat protein [Planctomycetota bacterium]